MNRRAELRRRQRKRQKARRRGHGIPVLPEWREALENAVELRFETRTARGVAEAMQGCYGAGIGYLGGLSNGRPYALIEHETKVDAHGRPLWTRAWLPG